jgi:hypothetical protein
MDMKARIIGIICCILSGAAIIGGIIAACILFGART